MVPEIVDVEFFSRRHCMAMACPSYSSLGGCRKVMKPPPPAAGKNISLAEAMPSFRGAESPRPRGFCFFSVFKWEWRKVSRVICICALTTGIVQAYSNL